MGRKRKVPVGNEEKENENEDELYPDITSGNNSTLTSNGPIYTIMSKIQLNETYHKKYIKELKQLYESMDHDAFIYTFIKMIKSAMVADETNEFAHTTLLFCARFVGSFEGEETHPLLGDTCRWLLTTISNNPHIRYRLCQFVNMILNALGQEATLDDSICDQILEYMVSRLVDVAPNVRVQAILAMQRLQVPDNPDDPVLRSYQYHLCSDPSPRVRQAVITCMGRNYHTIPYILDRLWDIDEKVRRHTYLHMSSFPVRSYKVSQRLTLLEQGLNDRSESVRKVVISIMLQQWIESYQKDLIELISALKLDSNETEINRFRKIGEQALIEMFKTQSREDIVACLPLETEGEFYRCVPHDKLSLETAFYWQCLTGYLQSEMAEELDLIIPELSVFCSYVESYCNTHKREMDKFEAMEFQYILLTLMEILHSFDLGDEIGRGNLQNLLENLLRNFSLDENIIEVIVKCAENLITNQDVRHQFFLDIINDLCGLNAKQQDLVHDRNLISELLANSTDSALNLKLSSLKVKILDLEEQEMNYVQMKDYVRAQQIIEVKNTVTEEFTNLLRPLLEKRNLESGNAEQPQFSRIVKYDCILRSLQTTYYMVVSKRVKSLGHATCRLYNDFIFRNIASNQIAIRDWALKCGAAFSMLYEPLAKDVFDELYAQFFKNHNIRIWETAITCIFELLDRYGVDSFVVQEEQNKSKKTGRQLYNTLEFIDAEEDTGQSTTLGQGVGVIYMMSHFLDTCDDMCIVRAIINGFCRLVLHGHIENRDIIEKLLLRYFNPATEPEINQILSVFLENLIQHRKQRLLQPCLMTTVNSVLTAPYDSPLHDIRPETITHFIIDTTRPDALIGNYSENSHNNLALIFLNEMVNNPNNKELCKLLGKELLSLEVNLGNNRELKKDMNELADKIIQNKFDPKTVKNVIYFKSILDGVLNPHKKPIDGGDIDSDDEDEAEALPTESNLESQYTDATTPQVNTEENIDNIADPFEQTSSNDNESTLVQSQISIVSPSATNITTTFGSSNRTVHNLLRRKSRQSRNTSIDSTHVSANENVTRTSKIRIEARIDSDKKSNESPKISGRNNTRVRRSLRYRGEGKNLRAREPEIIEMILISPSKAQQNPCNSQTELISPSKAQQNSCNSQTELESSSISMSPPRVQQQSEISPKSRTPTNAKDHIEHKTTENETLTKAMSVTRQRRVTRRNNIEESEIVSEQRAASGEEMDSSEIIPASPAAAPLETTMRLRHTNLRSGRSRTFREGPQRNGKVVDSTPLRNGRKRVLRTSPVALSTVASTGISSPARKQQCIKIASTTSVLYEALKENTDEPTTVNVSISDEGISPVRFSKMKEKLIQTKIKNKMLTNTMEKSQQGPVVTTRNSAKKKLMSEIIVTRKRLSMENIAIENPLLNSLEQKSKTGRSRIPIKLHREKNKYATVTTKNVKPIRSSLRVSRLPRKQPTKLLYPV